MIDNAPKRIAQIANQYARLWPTDIGVSITAALELCADRRPATFDAIAIAPHDYAAVEVIVTALESIRSSEPASDPADLL